MVSLWPSRSSRSSEPSSADAGGKGGGSALIEMHGNTSRRGPGGSKPAGKQPVTKFTRNPQAGSRGGPQSDDPAGNRTAASVPDLDFATTTVQANIPTLMKCSPRRVEVVSQPGDASGVAELASSLTLSLPQDDGEAAESQEFDEVQITFRVPRAQPGNAPTDSEGRSLEELQEELAAKERLRQRAVNALSTKARECEDLLKIIRELTESRNRLASIKSIQSERLADLQQDYMRVARVADLSRALSKENIAKAAQATQRLHQVEEELTRQRLVNQQAKERYARLKLENMELREKIGLLERLDLFAYRAESACMVKFQQYTLKETY